MTAHTGAGVPACAQPARSLAGEPLAGERASRPRQGARDGFAGTDGEAGAGWEPGGEWEPGREWEPEDVEAWLASLPAEEAGVTGDSSEAGGEGEVTGGEREAVWGNLARVAGGGVGFDAGGVGDRVVAGVGLAGLAAWEWEHGLGRLSDDELVGVMLAWRRVGSWAAAGELAAVTELAARRARRAADEGDPRWVEFLPDELAVPLTLTARGAEGLISLAEGVARLPVVGTALAQGLIDRDKARVICEETSCLSQEQARAVAEAVIGRAGGQTRGLLRASVRRAVLAADPEGLRRRQQAARKEARVEVWDEPGRGTTALAGRDLRSADALAADKHLTALARDLQAAGVQGTLDQLRARVYTSLLRGHPMHTLYPKPAGPPDLRTTTDITRTDTTRTDTAAPGSTGPSTSSPATAPDVAPPSAGGRGATKPATPVSAGTLAAGGLGTPQASTAAPATAVSAPAQATPVPREGASQVGAAGGRPGGRALGLGLGEPGGLDVREVLGGSVHLTMPLSAWLGTSAAPGEIAGFGPVPGSDARALAALTAARPGSRWCLTLTDDTGRAIAHGCAHTTGAPAASDTTAGSDTSTPVGIAPAGGPAATGATGPGPGPGPGPGSGSGPGSGPSADGLSPSPGGPGDHRSPAQPPPPARARRTRAGTVSGTGDDWVMTVTIRPLAARTCAHTRESAGYRPSPGLRHLLEVRQRTCSFPTCRRAANRCDLDHTLAYAQGGRTCECGLAPLCRRHHQAKQAHGWRLEQPQPGVLIWRLPHGRAYRAEPDPYPDTDPAPPPYSPLSLSPLPSPPSPPSPSSPPSPPPPPSPSSPPPPSPPPSPSSPLPSLSPPPSL